MRNLVYSKKNLILLRVMKITIKGLKRSEVLRKHLEKRRQSKRLRKGKSISGIWVTIINNTKVFKWQTKDGTAGVTNSEQNGGKFNSGI